jgi:hypothetical protein
VELAIERPTPSFGSSPTPLFEKERDSGLDALVSNVLDPHCIDRPCPYTGLASRYDPIDASKAELIDRTDQWFAGYEANRRRNFAKMPDSECISLVFDANAHP